MIIEILKAIEREIGIEIVINFLCLILGIGLGGGITDAIYSYTEKGEDNEDKLYKTQNDTYGCGTTKTTQNVTDRKRGKDYRGSKKARGKDRG